MKTVILFSGGLDSILAARIVSVCHPEAEAVYFYNVFIPSSCREVIKEISLYTEKLNIPLKVFDISGEVVDLVKVPKYGHGVNLNPCIDCKILMFKKAGEYMENIKAKFIVSGDVLGERPMSQRKDIFNLIEKETGLTGLILRPLSAKLLKVTIPEEKGWIKRENLYAISGRSRKEQIGLAKEFGIDPYPAPAGGCLLTDPGFCRRLKDLLDFQPDFDKEEVSLLKIGRHFRISSLAKLIVPRNEKEEKELMAKRSTNFLEFIPSGIKGRLSLGVGNFGEEEIKTAVKIAAFYTQKDVEEKTIKVVRARKEKIIVAKPLSEEGLGRYRI